MCVLPVRKHGLWKVLYLTQDGRVRRSGVRIHTHTKAKKPHPTHGTPAPLPLEATYQSCLETSPKWCKQVTREAHSQTCISKKNKDLDVIHRYSFFGKKRVTPGVHSNCFLPMFIPVATDLSNRFQPEPESQTGERSDPAPWAPAKTTHPRRTSEPLTENGPKHTRFHPHLSLYLLDCVIRDSLTDITLENLNPGPFYSALSSAWTLILQGAPWTPDLSPPSLHWPQRVSPRPPPREPLLPLLKDPETWVSPSTAPRSLQDNRQLPRPFLTHRAVGSQRGVNRSLHRKCALEMLPVFPFKFCRVRRHDKRKLRKAGWFYIWMPYKRNQNISHCPEGLTLRPAV